MTKKKNIKKKNKQEKDKNQHNSQLLSAFISVSQP